MRMNEFQMIAKALERGGISNAQWEARELLAAALNIKPVQVMMSELEINQRTRLKIARWTKTRLARKPLAYVLGEWDFAGLRLKITEDVLVPRPETEELFELVVSEVSGAGGWGPGNPDPRSLTPGPFSIVDVGTGSGCLAIALAKSLPKATIAAVDISEKALSVARANAEVCGVASQINFQMNDLLDGFEADSLDAVVANLPYIDTEDINGLEPEVQHEPRVALDGGRKGLELVRRLIPQAFSCLKTAGKIYLEIGYNQAKAVAAEIMNAGFSSVEIRKDLSGVARFVAGKK